MIVKGTGWWDPTSNGVVRIFVGWDFTNPSALQMTVTPDSDGTFRVRLIVPDLGADAYEFVACQRCGDPDGYPSASFIFEITAPTNTSPTPPTLSLAPASAPSGQTVTATGTGWDPSVGDVSIFADQSDATDPSAALVTVTPDPDGKFSVSLTAPDKPAGTYQFVACQRCGDPDAHPSATAPFEISVVSPKGPPPTVTEPPGITASPIASTSSPSSPAVLIVLVILAVLAVALWLLLRQRPTARRRRPTWELKAEDTERKGPCSRGSWYCHRGSPQLELKRRRITALPVRLVDSETGRAGRQVKVEDDVLAGLNRCLERQRARSAAAEVRKPAATAALSTWTAIQRELAAASRPHDVLLSIDVQGGQATCPFTLYQCQQAQDSTSHWTQRAQWTGKLKDEKSYAVGVLRSASNMPAIGDAVTEALTERFVDIVGTILTDSRLDRVRPGSAWELDLGRWGSVHW